MECNFPLEAIHYSWEDVPFKETEGHHWVNTQIDMKGRNETCLRCLQNQSSQYIGVYDTRFVR